MLQVPCYARLWKKQSGKPVIFGANCPPPKVIKLADGNIIY